MGGKPTKESNGNGRDSPEMEYLNCCQLNAHQKSIARERQKDGVIDPTFTGPLKKRSCTDVICLLLFIVFLAAWVALGVYAFKSGNFGEIFAPRDSKSRKCGYDEGLEDKSDLLFFDITKCVAPRLDVLHCDTPQVCVTECPTESFSADYYKSAGTSVANIRSKLICVSDVDTNSINDWNTLDKYIKDNLCASWYVESMQVAHRCLPDLSQVVSGAGSIIIEVENGINVTIPNTSRGDMAEGSQVVKILSNAKEFWQGVAQDMVQTWPWIVVCIVAAMVVCLLYIIIMRWIAGIMIWFSLVACIAMLSYCSYITWIKYDELRLVDSPVAARQENKRFKSDLVDALDDQFNEYLRMKETWLAFFIISVSVLSILLVIIIFLRSRIVLAIALINEGSKAVSNSWSVLFIPILPFVVQLGVVIYGGAICLFLFSSGIPVYTVQGLANDTDCKCDNGYKDGFICLTEIFNKVCKAGSGGVCQTASCAYSETESNNFDIYLQLYNLFVFFWGLFFVSAVGKMILASVFATYYFTFYKSDIPFFVVTSSAWRVIRYHLGTAAFGSFLLAVISWIRVVFEFADRKLKKYDNQFVRAIKCCLRCFFWCLEKFIRFLNKNAYIMCAIHGKNFCVSAKDAFSLLLRNVVRAFVLDKVTDFLFFVSKLLITAAAGALSFHIFSHPVLNLQKLDDQTPYEANYYFVPMIITCVGTYFIASLFFSVYSTAVDTLFLCFLHDREINDGSAEKPYFMSKNLMSIMNKKNKKDNV